MILLGVLGALTVLVALSDLFVTVFNYDGFSFIANRLHGLWKGMRLAASLLPETGWPFTTARA